MFRNLSSAMLVGTVLASSAWAEAQDGTNAVTGDASTSASLIEDVGASERINFSGKMRMLTQRIAASACYSNAGIAPDASAAMLVAASAEFEQILNALRMGDDTLNIIGEEADRRVLADLDAADALWAPLSVDLAAFETAPNDGLVAQIAVQTERTLDVAKHLVSVLTGEYADPTALLQSDALTIDIAGRQRMLAQRVSKNVCLLSNGIEVDGAADQLAGAVRIYQASITALRNGHPDAGVNAPPNEEIANGLDAIIADWDAMQPILTTVIDGGTISAAEQEQVFTQMNSLTGQMNVLVGIYTEESKLDL